jgi:hypothetical protein
LLAAGLDGGAAGGDGVGGEVGAPPRPAVAGLDLPVVVVGRDLEVGVADLANTGLVVADDVERQPAGERDQLVVGRRRG